MTWPLPLSTLGEAALAILVMMSLLWLWSLVRRDASVVDPFWSIGFLLVSGLAVWRSGLTPGKLLLLATVGLWSLRLWLHLTLRARGKPEDPRYQAFRQRFGPERYWWVSFFQVFLLQGVLMLLVSAPLLVAGRAEAPDPLAWNDLAGAAVWTIGFLVEAIADLQLTRFRADPALRGRVLDTGLWRYSRHPNYFGESLLGWGLFLLALDEPGGWLTVFAPLLMTYLLLRVSGVTLLEQQLGRAKPGYAAYVRRTSAFVLWPPRAD